MLLWALTVNRGTFLRLILFSSLSLSGNATKRFHIHQTAIELTLFRWGSHLD
uniref:Uncharacterized protein n=1 Tax=Anguilla anguilla TaxID=7936 RepID=A0A0E9SV92_ANGAN